MSPDLINAAFEFCAAIAVALHCRAILHDREVHGVSTAGIGFFVAWGFWNLYYYPHLEQPLSFVCGIAVTVVNLVYVGLLMYYGECMWPWRLYAFLLARNNTTMHRIRALRRQARRRVGALVCWVRREHDWPGLVLEIQPYSLCYCLRCGREIADRTFADIRPMTDEEWEIENRLDNIYLAEGLN